MDGAIFLVFLFIILFFIAIHMKQQIESNRCRICERALSTPQTRTNRLCPTHEEGYAPVAARIIPYKYWKKRYLFKAIAVGSGASSLIHRFAEFGFLKSFIHTIGVDIATKIVKIGDQTIKLLIFVIGGQKSFTRLRPYYYRGAKGAILCYDITSWSTFKAIYGWLNEIYIHLGSVPRILVGNKMDLANQQEVPRSYAEAYAQENGLSFIETSTKTGMGVDVMFATLARMMLEAACQLKDKPNSTA